MTPKHHSHDEQPDESDFGCCGGHGHDCCGGHHDHEEGDMPYSVRARQLEILERVLNRMVREGKFANAEEGSRRFEALLAERGADDVFNELELTPQEKSLLLVAQVGLAQTDEEAESLLREALEIDPHNLDAQVLLIGADTPANEARRLREIVRNAEANLGPAYFETKRGEFYVDPETRPYLRARQALMVALGAMKDYDGAIAEAEGMLELCPQDHIGVRDYLAGYYLAAEQTDKALALMDERYEADDGPVFQYARMIAHHRLGHEDEALEVLDSALEANPYVIPILLGVLNAEEIAEDMSPGTPGQALYVIGTLYDAMLRNEPAMEWAAGQWVERVRAHHEHGQETE
ncbi:MAG: tetratricopeptide repeat protein [Candidatus Sumerlaeaceae bacterium]